METDLLERADRAIAESKRLIAQLHEAICKAEQLDSGLWYLHQLRIEQSKKQCERS